MPFVLTISGTGAQLFGNSGIEKVIEVVLDEVIGAVIPPTVTTLSAELAANPLPVTVIGYPGGAP